MKNNNFCIECDYFALIYQIWPNQHGITVSVFIKVSTTEQTFSFTLHLEIWIHLYYKSITISSNVCTEFDKFATKYRIYSLKLILIY